MAYDAATGAKVWVSRYDGPATATTSATALGVSPDGSTVFVTGSSDGSNDSADYATVAYDAATGARCGSSATTARPTATTTPAPWG